MDTVRKTKRQSGAEYRRKRLRKEAEVKKIAGSLNKYFQRDDHVEENPSTSALHIDSCTRDIKDATLRTCKRSSADNCVHTSLESADSVLTASKSTGDVLASSSNENEEAKIVSDLQIKRDPGTWPNFIPNNMARVLIQEGPSEIPIVNFPTNKSGRKFCTKYCHRTLANGEQVKRNWLVYSISKDSVFCFCCRIFDSLHLSSFSDSNGFLDWQHLSRSLDRHEKSKSHNENVNKWVNLNKMLISQSTVNQIELRLLNVEKKYWYEVISRIISVIKLLSRQSLALRGTNEKLYHCDNGNFLKTIEMIAEFDPVIREHVQRVQKAYEDETRITHYLGNRIQNEIINLMASNIKIAIMDLLNQARYFSVILDCTPDKSHTEQISIIIRFVLLDSKTRRVEIREHFLGFCPIFDSTGKGLSDFLLKFFEENQLNINDLRGQGYDNGANFRGIHQGLQKRILDVNSRALYVPCSAHTLNLAINDAAKISNETVNFFSIVQDIYIFFSGSTKRWAVLKRHVSSLTLKPISDTRWSSRIDAVTPLRYELGEIIDACLELTDNSPEFDSDSRHKAQCLVLKIQEYKFIASIIIWHNILHRINIVSKLLQKPALNVKTCLDYIKNLINYFEECRSDSGYNTLLVDATTLAEELDVETDFKTEQILRRRIKRKMFTYEHNDETPHDPKVNFKINFYFSIIDQTLLSLRDRFEKLETFGHIYGFLFKIFEISDNELYIHCKTLQSYLTNKVTMETDINGEDLCNEIKALKLFFQNVQTEMEPIHILQYILENDLVSSFPNVAISFRLFFTLPVSIASAERSFSKLKLIKNYLRTTMIQDRFSNLAIIAIEQTILDSLNLSDMVQKFADLKARNVQLL